MSVIKVKNAFNICAISAHLVVHSLSMISSSGKRLFEAFESPFSVSKCAQICFISFDLLIDSERCLRFEPLINCLVLFRCFLFSVHIFYIYNCLVAFAFALCLE